MLTASRLACGLTIFGLADPQGCLVQLRVGQQPLQLAVLGLQLLQNCDDLLFRKSSRLHICPQLKQTLPLGGTKRGCQVAYADASLDSQRWGSSARIYTDMNALIFLAHNTSPRTLSALEKLRSEKPDNFTLFPIFDVTKKLCASHLLPADSLCAEFSEITRELQYPGKIAQSKISNSFYPGCQDLILMWFFRKYPSFDFYWFVEYDVNYTGHWNDFFKDFITNDSSMLATTIFRYDFRPSWNHWKDLKVAPSINKKNYIRALCCIARYSRTAFLCLNREYQKGYSGHFECLIPTLLQACNLTIEDFGGDGEFVKQSNINKYYFNNPKIMGLLPGSFTAVKNSFNPELHPPLLQHPVKE
jgi:hypothetical protein